MHQTTSDNQQVKDSLQELKGALRFTLLSAPLKGGLNIV